MINKLKDRFCNGGLFQKCERNKLECDNCRFITKLFITKMSKQERWCSECNDVTFFELKEIDGVMVYVCSEHK